MEYKFIYNWANNSKRKTMKGRKCRILAKGKKNSIMIEFEDNKQIEIVSINSLKLFEGKKESNLKELF
jgi:hypothetical protein